MKNRGLKQLAIYLVLALSLIMVTGASAETELMPVEKVVADYQNSVVQITVSTEVWNRTSRQTSIEPAAYGSGTFIRKDDEGCYILTNYHVVEPGDKFEILWYDGSTNECELVGYDSSSDIAVLYFKGNEPEGAKVLPIGNSSDLRVGQQIVVIGNPVTSKEDAYALYDTVTVGYVSGVERDINTSSAYSQSKSSLRAVKLVQVDASINSGVSGGALINLDGELVGIPTVKYSSAEGLGFCIAIDSVKTFMDDIIDHGSVQRPMLGVTVSDFDGPDEPMRNYAPKGIAVRSILEKSGAAESDLRMYDIITEINGVRVFDTDDLTDQVALYKAGDVVTLTVYRYYDEKGEWVGQPDGALKIDVELRILDN